MLLYDSAPSGNCYKVRLLLGHLGIAYERQELSVVDRSNRADLIGVERNPALRVPTLILDDGRSLAESNAILWYFADGTEYVPTDATCATHSSAVCVRGSNPNACVDRKSVV